MFVYKNSDVLLDLAGMVQCQRNSKRSNHLALGVTSHRNPYTRSRTDNYQ
jgi:hypothetical protein